MNLLLLDKVKNYYGNLESVEPVLILGKNHAVCEKFLTKELRDKINENLKEFFKFENANRCSIEEFKKKFFKAILLSTAEFKFTSIEEELFKSIFACYVNTTKECNIYACTFINIPKIIIEVQYKF